jgi:hypothetical protein
VTDHRNTGGETSPARIPIMQSIPTLMERRSLMGPLTGTSVRLAAGWVLLSVAAASCASPGASPPGAAGQGSVTGPLASPTAAVSGVHMTNGPPGTATAPPTTPVPAGCPSGTVVITHHPYEGNTSAVCIKAGARLRLTLTGDSSGWTWGQPPLQVTPEGAATVASTTDPTGTVHAIVSPTGAARFCLSTGFTNPNSAVDPVYGWSLCVTVRH